ncbi:MAG TPA: UDP-glucose/GDP-mannose dehydrogenase family protein, partial [Flavipsychrobacter sp.]|nr:UDP-glucose/GDP-mannose dehydrogenase family protein [Flavipsychrobacter sp.]
PEAMENVKRLLGDKIAYADNQYDAITGADALVIVTEWSEFRNPDFARISETLKMPVIFDGRNVYTLEKMEECGFYYESIGRKVVNDKIRASIAQPVETTVRERKVID